MSSTSSISFGYAPASFLAGSPHAPGTHQEPVPTKRPVGRPRKYATDEERIQKTKERLKEQGYLNQYNERTKTYRMLADLDESDPMRSLLRHLELIYKGQWRFPDTPESRQMIAEMIAKLPKTPGASIQ